jgi:hypothetical protein
MIVAQEEVQTVPLEKWAGFPYVERVSPQEQATSIASE